MSTDTILSFIQQPIFFYIVFNVFIFGIIIYNQLMTNVVSSWPSVPGKIKTSFLGVGSGNDPTPGTYLTYTF